MPRDLISDFRAYNTGADEDQAHVNLTAARDTSPDDAAKRAALAARWGVGLDTAKVQQPLLERAAKTQADQETLATAPRTTAFLAKDPVHAAVSHDHVADISLTERMVEGLKATTMGFKDALLTGGTSFVTGAIAPVEAFAQGTGMTKGAAALGRIRGSLEAITQEHTPQNAGMVTSGLFSGVQSAAQMVPAVAIGTAQPAAGLAMMTVPVGGNAYGQARNAGKDWQTAFRYALTQGGVEWATEKIPFGKLVGDVASKTGFWKTVRGQIVREVPGEEAATLLQGLDQWLTIDHDKQSFGDYLKAIPGDMAQTLIATMVTVGATTGAAHGASALGDRLTRQDAAAERAPTQVDAFNDLVKQAQALPLRERAPEVFASLMEDLTPGIDVHVNAGALTSYLQSSDPEDANRLIESLGIKDQLDAATPDTDIVIKASDYLTKVAPTDAHKALEKDLKIGPAGMSLNEAEAHKADREELLASAASKALDKGAQTSETQDPVERVRQHFHDQAVAVGVPEAQAAANAAVQAAYYAQRAERNPAFKDAWDAYAAANISMQGGGATTEGPGGANAASGNTFALGNDVFPGDRPGSGIFATAIPFGEDDGLSLGAEISPRTPDLTDKALDQMRAGKAVALGEGPSLVQALVSAGGVRDDNGDLAAMDVGQGGRLQKMLRRVRTGMSVDEAAQWAQERGYLGDQTLSERATANDLLDAIRKEISGTKIYAAGRVNEEGRALQDRMDDLEQMLSVLDVDPSTHTNDQIRTTIDKYFAELDPQNSFEQGPRGQVTFSEQGALIQLFKGRNASTLIHEGAGHIWLENLAKDAADPQASDEVKADFELVKAWWRENIAQAATESGLPEARLLKAIDAFGGVQNMTAQQADESLDGIRALAKSLNVELEIETRGADDIMLQWIKRAPRKKGTGAQVLKALLAHADATGSSVTLGITDNKGARKLQSYYEDFGFERDDPYDDYDRIMTRFPAEGGTFEQGGKAKSAREDVEAIRPFHEMFARAAERYFMEGKAPTEALRGPFAKFRQWLVGIYKDFTALRVPMTDEMRGVFDRLVAVPQALDEAQSAQGLDPLPADKLTDLMSPEELAAYMRLVQIADDAAHDRLLGKVMGDVRRKYTDAWKSERAALVEDYQAQVNETPEMQALTLLESGEVRLSRQAIEDAGVAEAQLYRRQRPYVFAEGLDPDVVAEQVGLPSGQSLLEALVKMKAEHDALRAQGDKRTVRVARAEALADNEMDARHGDILNDGTIGDEAVAALNELRRSEVLMSELRALVRKAGSETLTWTPAEMKAWAERQMTGRKLEGIRPHIYAAAEAKAGRDALKALVKDDFAGALDAKFRQLLNVQLFRAARDAREEITKGKAMFDSIAKARNGSIAKTRNMDMVEAARAIIAGYGFGSPRNDADYMRKLEDYNPLLYGDLKTTLENAARDAKPIDEVTFDDFQSLRSTVAALWRQSREDRQIETDGEKQERDDVRQELIDHLGTLSQRPQVVGRDATKWDKFGLGLLGAFASTRRVEQWVTLIDGGPQGPFRKYIWNRVSAAGVALESAKRDVTQQYLDLFAPVAEKFKRGKINAPQLDHVFGYANHGLGMSEMVHMLGHMGNDSNKRKLLLGRGWGTEDAEGNLDTSRVDAFIQDKIADGTITKEVMDYVQGLWDLMESLKPQIQEVHRAVYGRYMDEVPATPFNTPWGEYRGGYLPAIYDTFFAKDQAQHAEVESILKNNDAAMFPTTNKGMTKGRTDYTGHLALDVGLLLSHINKVLTFVHMTQPVTDVAKLFGKNTALMNSLNLRDPVAWSDMLLPWLNRTARQTVETPTKGPGGKFIDDFFRAIRHRAGMGLMMGNVSNTLQQFTGQFAAMAVTPPKYVAAANWRVMRDPAGTAAMIQGLSDYMGNRMSRQMDEVRAQLDYLLSDPTKFQQANAFAQKHAYFLQKLAQDSVDTVVWIAAFEHGVEQWGDYEQAVLHADSVVRTTQGSLAPQDISRAETGPAILRSLTQFYSFFNSQMNLGFTQGALAQRDPDLATRAGRTAYVYATVVMMPAFVSGLIMQTLGAGWDADDPEKPLWKQVLDVFFGSQFTYMTGMVPYLGGVANAAVNAFDKKPYNDSINPPPGVTSLANALKVPYDWTRVGTEGKGQKAAVRDTMTLLTLASGNAIPQMMGRPLGYLADVNEGKVQPTGPVDLARGLMTGTASNASKVN